MQKLHSFTVRNFKYFYGEVRFDIEGRNLLVYGENGSGKSSIYWALYTFLQSAYKPDAQEIAKYFDRTKDENLVNRFAPVGEESSIVVEFINEHRTIIRKEISLAIQNVHDGTLVKEAAQAGDFFNYRALSNLYNFSNKQQIDLFPLFESDLLQFISFTREVTPGVPIAIEWWRYIRVGPQPSRPKMHTVEYRDFKAKVEQFNEEFEQYLGRIFENANTIFRRQFKQPLKILFEYKKAAYDDFESGSTTKRNHRTVRPQVILSVEYDHNNLAQANKKLNRPHTFLNEAKLSSISLSIRLAILEDKYLDAAPKILVIDDLLISLDMENRDQVLELILNNYRNYQLIIMTHDRSFFNLTKRRIQLAGHVENWSLKEIYADESLEGIPRPYIPNNHDYLDQARKYIKEFDYPASVNYLRKETERLLKSLLPTNLIFAPSDEGSKPVQLEGLIDNFRKHVESYGADFGDFVKLKEYKDLLLNPLSHDNIHTPIYKSELFAIIEKIQFLRAMKFARLVDISQIGRNIIYLHESDNNNVAWTYTIELLEHFSYLRLRDGSLKIGNPECKFLVRNNPALPAPEDLGGKIMKLSKGYGQIRYALHIQDIRQPAELPTIVEDADYTLLTDLLLAN